MWKNLLFFILGALVLTFISEKPISAERRDYAHVLISMSDREFAVFNRTHGIVYYYDKLNGKHLRAHQIKELGQNMDKVK